MELKGKAHRATSRMRDATQPGNLPLPPSLLANPSLRPLTFLPTYSLVAYSRAHFLTACLPAATSETTTVSADGGGGGADGGGADGGGALHEGVYFPSAKVTT